MSKKGFPKSKYNRHPSEYLNDLEEWGDHQYDPGYYTGGKMHPHYKYGCGTFCLLIVILFLVLN
jgi:hypothetical protein